MQRLGMPGGAWELPMPAPRLFGHYGADSACIGLYVGTVYVARRAADPVTGRPIESPRELIERAATEHGTAQPFEYAYAPDSP